VPVVGAAEHGTAVHLRHHAIHHADVSRHHLIHAAAHGAHPTVVREEWIGERVPRWDERIRRRAMLAAIVTTHLLGKELIEQVERIDEVRAGIGARR